MHVWLADHGGAAAGRRFAQQGGRPDVVAEEAGGVMAQERRQRESRAELDPLLFRIHAFSDSSGDWGDVLAMLRERMDARLATMSRHHFATGHGEVICETPASPGFRAAYAEYASRNPWFLSSEEYTAGRIVAGEDLLNNRDLVKTDFYRGLLEPHGLFHCVAGVAVRRGAVMYYVSALRGQDQPPFREREKAGLRTVLAHLSLAFENRWRLRAAGDLLKVMMGVVDRHPHPCLLVEPDGRIVYGNRCATPQAMPEVGLCVDGTMLAAALAIDRPALRQAIRQVAARGASAPEHATRAVTLSVSGSNHPSVVSIDAAGRVFDAASGDLAELVLVTARTPALGHDFRTCTLVRDYGLSPAQARVGVMIVTGHSLAETARKLHVSDNTVRSHLKQVFQKTNTHGQMELVHLHARVCAPTD